MKEESIFPKATKCPWCDKEHDAATCLNNAGAKPDDGSLTMCIGCGEWAIFDSSSDGGLRKPNDAEFVEIAANELCQMMRQAFVKNYE